MRRMVFSIHAHPRAAAGAFRPEEVVGNGYRVLIVAFVMQDRFRKPHRVGRVCRSRRPVVVVVRGKGDLRWRRAHVICKKKSQIRLYSYFWGFFLTFNAANQRVGSPPSVFLASQRRVGRKKPFVAVAGKRQHVAVDETGQLGLPLVDDVGRCSVERRYTLAD